MPQGLQLGHSLVPRFGTVTQHVPGSAFTFSFHRPHDSLTPGHTYRSVTSQLEMPSTSELYGNNHSHMLSRTQTILSFSSASD